MSPVRPGAARVGWRHVLAGIGAGVAGAIFVIAFLMLDCLWYHRSAWLTTNLFSTALFGPDAYVDGFVSTSLAGIAIILVMYGMAGAIWGVIWRDRSPRFVLVSGAICGAITYFVLFDLLWKRLAPYFWLYAPERELEFANVIWGMIMARSPRFAAHMRHIEVAQEPEVVEVRSGEVIEPETSYFKGDFN